VAGLLHDIGKTYTNDIKGRPTAAARLYRHDDLALEACAYGLAYLDKVNPDAALTLRHIWTCASPGAGNHCGYPTSIWISCHTIRR
jgi:3'-5' exoribonuclease